MSGPTAVGTAPRARDGGAALLVATARAEWSRVWTVRSSWVLLAATAVVVLGLATLVGVDAAGDPELLPDDATAWDGSAPMSMFALFGMLALAAVVATADHQHGGIVATLQWTPRRGVLLAARTAVAALTATVVGLALVVAATVLIRLLVPEVGLPVDDGAQVLGGLALVMLSGTLFAIGLGLALRSTAGTLVCVLALMLVLPPLLANLPYAWAVHLSAATPGSSALFLVLGEGPVSDTTTTSARLTLAAWAVGATVLGGGRLLRSDAQH